MTGVVLYVFDRPPAGNGSVDRVQAGRLNEARGRLRVVPSAGWGEAAVSLAGRF